MTTEPATDAHAMQLQIETLFRSDPRGRVLTTAEPSDSPAPRFFLGRTRHGNLWRFRSDVGEAAVRHLSRLASREPALAEAPASEPVPPERMQAFRDVLQGEGEPIQAEWRGPAFRVPEEVGASGGGAEVVRVTLAHGDALAPYFSWLPEELSAREPAAGVLVGGAIVSLCCCARIGPGAAEASLETAEVARRRGFARSVLAHWARAMRAAGRIPLYSTSWSNAASRAVAAKLGLVAYGEDIHFI